MSNFNDASDSLLHLHEGGEESSTGPGPDDNSGIKLVEVPPPLQQPVTIAELLESSEGPLDCKRAAGIIIEACDYLIARGLPHGDLTPEILVVFARDDKDEVVVDDMRGGGLNQKNVYRAPERFKGKKVSSTSDVYAMGVMLYEMVTNKQRCAAQTHQQSKGIAELLKRSPAWEELPGDLQWIIYKAVSNDPAARYKSAAQLKTALQHYLAGNTSKNSPPLLTKARAVTATLIVAAMAVIVFCFDSIATVTAHNNAELSGGESVAVGKFDVVVVLDRSGSMGDWDCPLGGTGLNCTRWAWAKKEMEIFARQTTSCLPVGFDVVVFDDEFKLYKDCKPADLARIYEENGPRGGTMLGVPLKEAFSLRNKKPLAVIVITDGLPGDEAEVRKQICTVTKSGIKASDLRIVFLTVGQQSEGAGLLRSLDNNLAQEGASFDAVTTMPFGDLQKTGLSHALAKAIETEPKKPNK